MIAIARFCITLDLDLCTHCCGLLINTDYKNHAELKPLHKTAFPILMLLSVSRQAKIINNRYQKGLGGVPWSPWRSSFLCCSFSFTPSAHAFVSLPITHSQTLPGAAEGQLMPWDVTYLLHILNGWQPAAGWWECTSIQWVSRIWTDRNWSLVHSPWLLRKSVQSLPSHIWSCDKAAASSSRYMKLYMAHRIDCQTDRLSRARLMPHSKGALQSLSFLHRVMKINLCTWRHHFQFALKTGRAKSLHHMQQDAGFASLQKPTKA